MFSRENVRKSHLHPFFFGVDFKTSFDFRINNMNLFDVMTYYAIIDKRIILLTTTQNFTSSLRLMAFKILFARSLNRMHPHVQKLTNTLLLKKVALRVILIVIRAVEVWKLCLKHNVKQSKEFTGEEKLSWKKLSYQERSKQRIEENLDNAIVAKNST